MTNSTSERTFDVEAHLKQRAENESLVMVELGHGNYPVFKQQPFEFTGQRAYIGIEAGMRSGRRRAEIRAKAWRRQNAGTSAFFVVQSIGKGKPKGDFRNHTERWLGNYDPRTILPDDAADELFLSNVFCDPFVAHSVTNTGRLSAETSRLLAPEGTMVLRETATPDYVQFLEQALPKLGLSVLGQVHSSNAVTWAKLEEVYGTHKDRRDLELSSDSYYLFLGHSSVANHNGEAPLETTVAV